MWIEKARYTPLDSLSPTNPCIFSYKNNAPKRTAEDDFNFVYN